MSNESKMKNHSTSILGVKENARTAVRIASELYSQSPDWILFFREVMGVNGIARSLFKNEVDFKAFEATPEYGEIQQMVKSLRDRSSIPSSEQMPTRVITVRVPASLHQSLVSEARSRHESVNKLCIRKLLSVLDEPTEDSKSLVRAKPR
jgi:predicted HicB family RNase H-like nuclease